MHEIRYSFYMLLSIWIISCYGLSLESKKVTFLDLKDISSSYGEGKRQYTAECERLDLKDVEFLEDGYIFILAYNATMAPTKSYMMVDNLKICFNRSEELKTEIFSKCSMWRHENDEFEILENGSVVLLSDVSHVLEPGTYEIVDNKLRTCFDELLDEDYHENSSFIGGNHVTAPVKTILMGKVGCSISIVALTAHLIIFCIVPTLRNLPGYNLASLSVAFLIAYLSTVVGQIPNVLGLSCILSGVVQLNCFLVAFFCTNVMAFDVWRSLRMATSKLAVSSKNKKKIQFIIYSIYSWGVPLLITLIVVIFDNVDGVPSWIKPGIGYNMTCWITNHSAKIIFFAVPALILFMINGVFFVLSAVIIKNNTMKNVNDQQNQTNKLNFKLYIRLGLMMGVTWLFSVLANLIDTYILWLISDFLNSLQGLFIFILFTCSHKVLNYFKNRVNFGTPKTSTTDKKSCSSSDKHTTNSSTTETRETTLFSAKPLAVDHATNSSTALTSEISFSTSSSRKYNSQADVAI